MASVFFVVEFSTVWIVFTPPTRSTISEYLQDVPAETFLRILSITTYDARGRNALEHGAGPGSSCCTGSTYNRTWSTAALHSTKPHFEDVVLQMKIVTDGAGSNFHQH